MFKFKRVTGYYVLEKKRNTLLIHHQPRWIFYFADKKRFFQKRRIAYEKIATLLKDPSFCSKQKFISTKSLSIDFTRETNQSQKVHLSWDDKPGILYLWFLNLYNWRFKRFTRLFRILRQKEVSSLTLPRESFIQIYEGR